MQESTEKIEERVKASRFGSWAKRRDERLRALARRKAKGQKIVNKEGKREPVAKPMFPARNPVRPPARRFRVGDPDGRTFDDRHPNYVPAVRARISQDERGRIRISTRWAIPPAPRWETLRGMGGARRRIGTTSHGRIKGATGAHP